jgi:hypothetical protein
MTLCEYAGSLKNKLGEHNNNFVYCGVVSTEIYRMIKPVKHCEKYEKCLTYIAERSCDKK